MTLELVTTSRPGEHEPMRCERCGDVLLTTRDRLPGLWHGTALAWCDDCIPHAPTAAADERRAA